MCIIDLFIYFVLKMFWFAFPNNLLARLMVVLETWWHQDATFLCNSPTVIFGDLFASLIILLAVRGGKINRDPLSRRFVTVTIALKFLSTALTVDMGIFRQEAFFYRHSLTYEAKHTFPSFDLCVLLCFAC